MCRFLLIQSKEIIDPLPLIIGFADMAEKSRTTDGDRQADGWGVAYKNESSVWQEYKSLKPVWEDREQFEKIPKGRIFALHARSASFPNQKGVVEYNQPYIQNDLCFVFNGVLSGVSFDTPIPGKIGAQKLFHLLQKELAHTDPHEALKNLNDLIETHTKTIGGLNIGIIAGDELFALCNYGRDPEYFSIRYHQDDKMRLVCSEELSGYKWQRMDKGQTIKV